MAARLRGAAVLGHTHWCKKLQTQEFSDLQYKRDIFLGLITGLNSRTPPLAFLIKCSPKLETHFSENSLLHEMQPSENLCQGTSAPPSCSAPQNCQPMHFLIKHTVHEMQPAFFTARPVPHMPCPGHLYKLTLSRQNIKIYVHCSEGSACHVTNPNSGSENVQEHPSWRGHAHPAPCACSMSQSAWGARLRPRAQSGTRSRLL